MNYLVGSRTKKETDRVSATISIGSPKEEDSRSSGKAEWGTPYCRRYTDIGYWNAWVLNANFWITKLSVYWYFAFDI